jgi:hypothetical protein
VYEFNEHVHTSSNEIVSGLNMAQYYHRVKEFFADYQFSSYLTAGEDGRRYTRECSKRSF